jgi:hypothetical protein
MIAYIAENEKLKPTIFIIYNSWMKINIEKVNPLYCFGEIL